MAAHAVATDQHQRAQALHDAGPNIWNYLWRRSDGRHAVKNPRPRRPGGACSLLQHRSRFVVQGRKEIGKAWIDRAWISRPTGIQITQESCIGPAESRRQDVHARHSKSLPEFGWPAAYRTRPPGDSPCGRGPGCSRRRPGCLNLHAAFRRSAALRHELVELGLVLREPQPVEELRKLLLLFLEPAQRLRAIFIERAIAAAGLAP